MKFGTGVQHLLVFERSRFKVQGQNRHTENTPIALRQIFLVVRSNYVAAKATYIRLLLWQNGFFRP